MRKNETLEEGAIRILSRETGIKSDEPRFDFVGVSQYFDKQVHCVSIVFKTGARSRSVVLDETSSGFGWFTLESCPRSLIPHYRKMLSMRGLDTGPDGWSEE